LTRWHEAEKVMNRINFLYTKWLVMIPARFAPVLSGDMLSGLMTLLVSGIATRHVTSFIRHKGDLADVMAEPIGHDVSCRSIVALVKRRIAAQQIKTAA